MMEVNRIWTVGAKIVPVINEALRTIKKGLVSCSQVTVGHRATEDHTNKHCTQHA